MMTMICIVVPRPSRLWDGALGKTPRQIHCLRLSLSTIAFNLRSVFSLIERATRFQNSLSERRTWHFKSWINSQHVGYGSESESDRHANTRGARLMLRLFYMTVLLIRLKHVPSMTWIPGSQTHLHPNCSLGNSSTLLICFALGTSTPCIFSFSVGSKAQY